MCTDEQAATEITESKLDVERITGRPCTAFAYPNGRPGIDYNADTLAILATTSVDMAFTTHPSFAKAGEPTFERSRFFMLMNRR